MRKRVRSGVYIAGVHGGAQAATGGTRSIDPRANGKVLKVAVTEGCQQVRVGALGYCRRDYWR